MRSPKVPPGTGGFRILILYVINTIMNEHQKSFDVSFRLKNILELNGRQIESADQDPDAFKPLIEYISDDIKLYMTELEQFDEAYRPTSSRSIRPVVLVARLALIDQQLFALNQHALISKQRHFTHPNVLTEHAFAYWNSINKERFQPQVHVLEGTDTKSSGVWLGVSEPYDQ